MNLLGSDDLSRNDIGTIFNLADNLKRGKEGLAIREHSVLALLFEEPSTRTRVSFEAAIAQLGGSAVYIDAQTTQMKRGETLADTARVISGYCDFIAMRTDDHRRLEEFAKNSMVPVINALTGKEHPTQALADVYTIAKHKSNLKGVRIAFLGDVAQNTANSLMLTAAKMGMEISLVGPKESKPDPFYYNKAREHSRVDFFDDIEEGVSDADVIYTDTFVSMGREADAASRKRLFAPYQLNAKVLELADSKALVMHPLPAHRGEEITADVLDGPNSVVWEQARNKLAIEKSLLVFLSERASA